MEWLTDALAQYIFIIGGSFAGVIGRLTREPLSIRSAARAIGALAITAPAAAEIIAVADLWARPHSQILLSSTFSFFGDQIVGSLEDRIKRWDWLRVVVPQVPPLPDQEPMPPEMQAALDRLDITPGKSDDPPH